MNTFLDNLREWLQHLPSRRVLLPLGAVLLVVASLTGFGVYALSNSGGSANPVPSGDSVDAALDYTPVHEPTDLVPTDTGPAPPPEAEAPTGDSQGGSAPAPSAPVDSGMRLVIEALGIDAPVITLGLDANAIPEVPLTGYQVAWYNFSAFPGSASNSVFSGHVTWRGQAVFYRLPELAPGSTVKVATGDGRVLVYEVFRNILVSETDVSVMAPSSEPIITIITCGGTWVPNPNEQFGGDYTGRTVVQARLISG